MDVPINGTVTWFDIKRGFGFITPEDGGENLFVHQSAIKAHGYRSLSVGEIVEFSVSVGEDGRRKAVNVTGPGGAYIKGRRYFGGACYRCGKVGHMAMECRSNGFCYGCGMIGHRARECSVGIDRRPENARRFEMGSSSVSFASDCGKKVVWRLFEGLELEEEGGEDEGKREEKVGEGLEQRNWAELPRDVLSVIFRKIAAVEIMRSAQFVCRPWRELSHEPDLWRRILVKMPDERMDMIALESMAMLAIERSKGCVEEFRIECSGSECNYLLEYMPERATKLRSLRLISIYDMPDTALAKAVEKFPLLEEFEISFSYFSPKLVELIGLACPNLKIFRLNSQPYTDPYDYDNDSDGNSDAEALAIANHMHQLQRLQLIGNSLTNTGLLAILDNCANLQHLDIRGCLSVNLNENIKKKCAMIKELRLPKESTADYELNGHIVGSETFHHGFPFERGFSHVVYDSDFYTGDCDYYDHEIFSDMSYDDLFEF